MPRKRYYYDTAWNLNRRTNNGVTGTFNVNVKNELTNAPSPASNQTYDNNGNLITSHSGKWVYDYDDENRLIEWASYALNPTSPTSGDKLTDFVYDGFGRLRKRLEYTYVGNQESPGSDWRLDSETRYIYDGKRVIQERDTNNTPTVSYTRGNDLSGMLEGAGRASFFNRGWPVQQRYCDQYVRQPFAHGPEPAAADRLLDQWLHL